MVREAPDAAPQDPASGGESVMEDRVAADRRFDALTASRAGSPCNAQIHLESNLSPILRCIGR
jgi:hypothetical protein